MVLRMVVKREYHSDPRFLVGKNSAPYGFFFWVAWAGIFFRRGTGTKRRDEPQLVLVAVHQKNEKGGDVSA